MPTEPFNGTEECGKHVRDDMKDVRVSEASRRDARRGPDGQTLRFRNYSEEWTYLAERKGSLQLEIAHYSQAKRSQAQQDFLRSGKTREEWFAFLREWNAARGCLLEELRAVEKRISEVKEPALRERRQNRDGHLPANHENWAVQIILLREVRDALRELVRLQRGASPVDTAPPPPQE